MKKAIIIIITAVVFTTMAGCAFIYIKDSFPKEKSNRIIADKLSEEFEDIAETELAGMVCGSEWDMNNQVLFVTIKDETESIDECRKKVFLAALKDRKTYSDRYLKKAEKEWNRILEKEAVQYSKRLVKRAGEISERILLVSNDNKGKPIDVEVTLHDKDTKILCEARNGDKTYDCLAEEWSKYR